MDAHTNTLHRSTTTALRLSCRHNIAKLKECQSFFMTFKSVRLFSGKLYMTPSFVVLVYIAQGDQLISDHFSNNLELIN